MDGQTWTANEMDLLAIKLLDWVASNDDSSMIPLLASFYGDPDNLTEEQSTNLFAAAKDLDDRGLTSGDKSFGGWMTYGPRLTSSGRSVVQGRKARRKSRRERSVAARDALLDWMFENTNDDTGEAPEIDGFQGSTHAHIEGEPFSEAEIKTAAKFLLHEKYVGGIGAAGTAVIRPWVESKGCKAVERGEYTGGTPATGSTNINVSGSNSVNVANQSPGAHQQASVRNEARNEVLTVASFLEEMLAQKTLISEPSYVEEAHTLVSQLREAAEIVESNPEPAEKRLGTLRTIAKNTFTSAVATALIALVNQAMQAL